MFHVCDAAAHVCLYAVARMFRVCESARVCSLHVLIGFVSGVDAGESKKAAKKSAASPDRADTYRVQDNAREYTFRVLGC